MINYVIIIIVLNLAFLYYFRNNIEYVYVFAFTSYYYIKYKFINYELEYRKKTEAKKNTFLNMSFTYFIFLFLIIYFWMFAQVNLFIIIAILITILYLKYKYVLKLKFDELFNIIIEKSKYYFNNQRYYLSLILFKFTLLYYSDLSILSNIGKSYIHLNKYTKAIVYFKKALDYNPDNKDLYIYLASCFYKMGKLDESLKYRLRVYNNMEDGDCENIWEIARIYWKKGKNNKAEKYLRDYIDLKPSDCDAYNFMSYILDEKNEIDKAIKYALKSYKCFCDKDNKEKAIEPLWSLVQYYKKKSNYKKVIKYLKQITHLNEKNLDKIYKLIGDYYNELGESEKVKKYYNLSKNIKGSDNVQ